MMTIGMDISYISAIEISCKVTPKRKEMNFCLL